MKEILLLQVAIVLLCVVACGTDSTISGTKSSSAVSVRGTSLSPQKPSPKTSPKTTPKTSPKSSPKTTPKSSPKISSTSRKSTTPRKITTTPRKITTTARKMTTTQRKITTTPRTMTTTPRKVTTTSRKMTTTPRKMTTTPRKITTTQRKITTSPRKMTTTPRKMTTTPSPGECVKVTSCSCRYKDGRVIDLSPLDGVADDTSPKFVNKKGPKNNKYTYNPCTAFYTGKCSKVAICQQDAMSTYSLGTQDSATFDSSKDGLVIKYKSMDKFNVTRTSQVTLTCAAGTDTFTPLGETGVASGLYKFTLRSPHCCAHQSSATIHTSPLALGTMLVFVWLARFL